MLSHFSCAQLFLTSWTAACQVPLCMGFSRQEYWSGLPFSPPGIFPTQGSNPHLLHHLHWQEHSLPLITPEKSLKWKSVKVAQFCLSLCDPKDCSLPGFSVHGILQASILEQGPIPFSRDLPDPGIKFRSPALQADLYLLNHQGSSFIYMCVCVCV